MRDRGDPSTATVTKEAVIGTMNGIIGVTRTSERPCSSRRSYIVPGSSSGLILTTDPSLKSSTGHTNDPLASAICILRHDTEREPSQRFLIKSGIIIVKDIRDAIRRVENTGLNTRASGIAGSHNVHGNPAYVGKAMDRDIRHFASAPPLMIPR